MTATNGQTPVTESQLTDLRGQLEVSRLKLQRRLLESQCDSLNFVSPYEPYFDDKSFWLPLNGPGESVPISLDRQGKGELLPLYLSWYGLKVIRDDSRRICAFNPFAQNIVSTRSNYSIGVGLVYTAEEIPNGGAQPGDAAAVQAVLDEFCDDNDWPEREQEASDRCDRDGEAFLRFFPQFDGRVLVRDIEPEQVRSPLGDTADPAQSFGVETDPEDVESIYAYHVRPDPRYPTTERIEADEILHLKANSHRNAKRGMPLLFPVRRNLERVDKLLRNMSHVAQIQAAIAAIRTHTNQPATAVQDFANAAASYTPTNPYTGRSENVTQYAPGSILDIPGTQKMEFPATSINAASFVGVIQAELRAIGARCTMPEYMVSGDASNANYSSTMVAESPVVRSFERRQSWFKSKFGLGGPRARGVMGRVIRAAIEAGRLPDRVLRCVKVNVEAPSLTTRDPLQEAQVRQIEIQAGSLDPQTWCELEGRDYAIVSQRNAEHQERFGPGPGALDVPPEE